MLIINPGRNSSVPPTGLRARQRTAAVNCCSRRSTSAADEDEDGVLRGFVINDALASLRHAQSVQWPR